MRKFKGKVIYWSVITACSCLFMSCSALALGEGVTVSGSCNTTAPVPSELAMVNSFDAVLDQIAAAGKALVAAQEVQSQISNQLIDQTRTTIKNTAKQSNMAQMESKLALRAGDSSKMQQVCDLAGNHGVAAGMDAGGVYAHNLSKVMNSVIDKDIDNTPSVGTSINTLATAPVSSISAANILDSNNPKAAAKAVKTTVDPLPLPKVPKNVENTPMGQRYKGLRNIQQTAVFLAKRVLTDVSLLNNPTMPLAEYAKKEAAKIQGSAAETASVNAVLGSVSGNRISQNGFLYIENMSMGGNPKWWEDLAADPDPSLALEDEEKATALSLDESYQNLLLTEDLDAAEAENDAIEYNSKVESAANQLRNEAMAEALNASQVKAKGK